MGTNESGLSHHPEDIKSALAREPIILGPESVGLHFRNSGEIADVQEVVMKLEGAIAIGLVGSRIHGRFSYTTGQNHLFTRLCFFFQRNLDLYKEETALLLGPNFEIPERFQKPFNDIAVLLNSAQASHDNLDDIDLSEFPSDLQQFLNFEPEEIAPDESHSPWPYIFLPRSFDQRDPDKPILLRPAAYFPDIDVAVISEDPLALVERTIGARSGVRIEVTRIDPFVNKSPWPGGQETIDSMVKNFRPLSLPAPRK